MSGGSNRVSSFRIVSADHYMSAPKCGLDPTFSEFRGCEIKQVPIIRIFGSNSEGNKCCIHVHGIFPYFCIPFDGGAAKNPDGLAHQVACSVDKALNITLGQSNASSQHVFKVVLVKGIPFYGYHPREHQFFKIYFYNPYLVKRAASLFQNGAILGRVFQAFDSHVPYILKFFIDFNLYGMSFLHVPTDTIYFRRRPADFNEIIESSTHIDVDVDAVSVSEVEVDVIAKFILNRLEYKNQQKAEHINPGIAFIWQDERMRRAQMTGSQIPPPVEQEIFEERPNARPTESDDFHRNALVEKLRQIITSQTPSDDTQNMTLLGDVTVNPGDTTITKKFNLKAILQNAVYPAETTQNDTLIEASLIDNPYTVDPAAALSISHQNNTIVKNSIDNSIIDEEIVLHLSQRLSPNDSLAPDDYAMLEILEKLERENEEENVDGDSILAPLTQQSHVATTVINLSQKLSGELVTITEGDAVKLMTPYHDIDDEQNSDDDDDVLNDFSIAMEGDLNENDENHQSPTNDSRNTSWDSVPQVDGAVDFGTPKKQIINRKSRGFSSPRSSPNNHRLKYSELDVKIIRSPPTNNGTEVLRRTRSANILRDKKGKEPVTPVKCENGKMSEIVQSLASRFRKSITPLISSPKGRLNPKKFEIRLTPIEKGENIPELNAHQKEKNHKSPSVRLKRMSDLTPNKKGTIIPELNVHQKEIIRKSPSVRLKRMSNTEIENIVIPKKLLKPSERYDLEHNFYPEAGPSRLISEAASSPPESPPPYPDNELGLSMYLEDEEQAELDRNICSFYDRTIYEESPEPSPMIIAETPHDSVIEVFQKQFNQDAIVGSSLDSKIFKIKPALDPPDSVSVMETLYAHGIPEIYQQEPFYGNPSDVTARKEVGLSVLKVCDRNAHEDFKSLIVDQDFIGLNEYRRKLVGWMINGVNNSFTNAAQIKRFLSTEVAAVIRPARDAPTYMDAKLWLEDKDEVEKSIKLKDPETPASVRREKIKLVLKSGSDNESEIELSISPLTPSGENISSSETKEVNKSSEMIPRSPTSIPVRRSHRKNCKARLSLSKRFNELRKDTLRRSIDQQLKDHRSESPIVGHDSESFIECGQRLSQGSNGSTVESHNSGSSSIIRLLLGDTEPSSAKTNLSEGELDRSCDLTGPTLDNTYGFKMQLENYQSIKVDTEYNYLTIISVEVFVKTRGDLRPDPAIDPISAIFYSIQNNVPVGYRMAASLNGILIVGPDDDVTKRGGIASNPMLQNCATSSYLKIEYGTTEKELLEKFCGIVSDWDPDIFIGYEIEMSSWGYIIERGFVIEINMPMMLSRTPAIKVNRNADKGLNDEYEDDVEFASDIKIIGRIIIGVWRLLRHEIALTSYTFENLMYHILHRRCSLHSHRDLTRMWTQPRTRWIVIEYYAERVKGSLELLDQLDLIGRTCELAKLFGILFYEVLSRGSQFRVESMMLRMAKPRNFVPVSPNVQQRAHMRAPEYLPLILEPQSRLYIDPVIVLDFQSLYPSMMIAYNYCFSTCLGRVEHLGQSQPFEFGASQLKVSRNLLQKFLDNDLVTISPCGVVFVKQTVREGTVPRMLKEILDTRSMVKKSMKLHKDNALLQRVLHSRQLGLKLIANVTYGYTAANFSGRMPAVEVGDSVVSKGRETLERSIKMIEANEKWRVKVVYGDTDSVFVQVPGRCRQEAFRIGEEIAKAVTNDNPQPVKLKLEKVYQPCILQTKKRYVGFMYETADQKEPIYEAKGIETVRRDGCPAVTKMLEKTIRLLFETKDVSLIKQYVCRQFTKILSGKINIQDLIFAKEFRGINGYKPTACVPALELTRRWQIQDRRAIPRRGERVPFIIANGPPGLPLIRLVRSPHEMLSDEGLKINAMYYINKVIIPPLNRCLLLIGIDVNDWMADLPRKQQMLLNLNTIVSSLGNAKKSTISQYFSTTTCITDCGNQTRKGVCEPCLRNPQKTVVVMHEKMMKLERKYQNVLKICGSCCGRPNDINCRSLDCPVLYKLNQSRREFNQIENFREILNAYF